MTNESSTVILGYGPQLADWFQKAEKLAGKNAVLNSDVARMAGATFAVGQPDALTLLSQKLRPGAIEFEKLRPNYFPLSGATEWLACGEHGQSSVALFTRLSGIQAVDRYGNCAAYSHPCDPSDFRRCRLMLEAVPSLVDRLPEAKDLSPVWAALIDEWDNICTAMDTETPDWRKGGGTAKRTYKLMKSIIDRAEGAAA